MTDTVTVRLPPGSLDGEFVNGELCVSVSSLIARLQQLRSILEVAAVHRDVLQVVDIFIADLDSLPENEV